MSSWKRLAVSLFPEHRFGSSGFQQPEMTIYQVFFSLRRDIRIYLTSGDQAGIERIFQFVNWCFSQRFRAPDIWNAAATAFVEHLADEDDTAQLIPKWISPEMFQNMWGEFEKRRERDGEGKFQDLLKQYDQENLTHYS